jgi:peptide subunit release factor 1 (eRF1)
VLPIERDVQDILAYQDREEKAFSVYLNTDPTGGSGRNLKAQMHEALRQIPEYTGKRPDSSAIEEAAAAALAAVSALRPIPRAAAAFIGVGATFQRVVPLPDPVVPSAHWGSTLHIRPLLAALDEHEHTVVALVDEERGHVFRVFMGQIERVATLVDEDPGHAQAGRSARKSAGASQVGKSWMAYGERNLQRRHEWHTHKHLVRVLAAMHPRGDRVFVGGARESVDELLRLLPRRLRARAFALPGIDIEASNAAVLERVVETQRQSEREEETRLLHVLSEEARSAFGATAVAEAVSDGRVHTLVYADSATMAGRECTHCNWMMPGAGASSCPRCGSALEETPDLIERLIARVIERGGRVEEVRGPARTMLRASEGVAALLRYLPTSTPLFAGSQEAK